MPTKANSISNRPKVAGLILAGGEGRRMGGNKPFRELAGKPLIAHAISAASAQCNHLMISSNEGGAFFAEFNLPVVPDSPQPRLGPLGGILGGLLSLPDGVDWLVSFPVDCPIVPDDMVAQLIKAATEGGKKAAFASHAGRDHYLSAIWHRAGAGIIGNQLRDEDRRVGGALRAMRAANVAFPVRSGDMAPFVNVNAPEDLSALDEMLSGHIDEKRL